MLARWLEPSGIRSKDPPTPLPVDADVAEAVEEEEEEGVVVEEERVVSETRSNCSSSSRNNGGPRVKAAELAGKRL